MVVSHHVMFYIAAVRADEPRLTAAWQHSPLLNFANSAGFPAVDGFFLISGFFTTWSLIQRKSEFSMAQCLRGVLARCLRFWPMHAFIVVLALLRRDPLFVDAQNGTLNVPRIVAMFVAKNYYDGLRGWLDLTTTPLWSNPVDMHVSALLIVLVPLARAMGWNLRRVLLGATAVAVSSRFVVFLEDPACHRLAACMDHPSTTFLGAGETLLDELQQSFGMPRIVEKACGCVATGCDLSNAAWMRSYASMYIPTHVRASPFFIGALLACSYKQALSSVAEWAKFNRWPSRGRLALALAWVLERHGMLGVLGLPGALATNLPEASLEVLGGLLDSCAWAAVAFAAIVPAAHPSHSVLLSRGMSVDAFRTPARLSFCIYCLHWPVLFDVMRYTPKDWLPTNVYLAFAMPFAVVMAITCVLSWLVHHLVEVPGIRLVRVMGLQPSAGQAHKAA